MQYRGQISIACPVVAFGELQKQRKPRLPILQHSPDIRDPWCGGHAGVVDESVTRTEKDRSEERSILPVRATGSASTAKKYVHASPGSLKIQRSSCQRTKRNIGSNAANITCRSRI